MELVEAYSRAESGYVSRMAGPRTNRLLVSVGDLLGREARLVLAVSGGIDSMTLMDAVSRLRAPQHNVVVATFDHGTGALAREATAMVAREAARRDFPLRTESAHLPQSSEAEWRAARWRFLRSVARAERAKVVTAHTRDDQVETVVMRILRGTGVRGLAGLYAESEVARPFLEHSRASIQAYASAHGVCFVGDPSNSSRAYFRNRVRLDLLPTIRSQRPEFDDEMLDLARQAAIVRHALDAVAGSVAIVEEQGAAEVPAAVLVGMEEAELRLLWQAIAARAGVILDWRGTVRVGRFSGAARIGQRVQLSGGHEVVRQQLGFRLQRNEQSEVPAGTAVLLRRDVQYGAWHFHRLSGATIKNLPVDPWIAALPVNAELVVRPWRPGDRIEVNGEGRQRRVKRFLAEARIVGPLRRAWPVVLAAGRVVWIPGIRRARTLGLSEEHVVIYRCERHPS